MSEGDPLHLLLWFSFLVPLVAFIVGAPLILRYLGSPDPPKDPESPTSADDPEADTVTPQEPPA
jgi:hypothetical protein